MGAESCKICVPRGTVPMQLFRHLLQDISFSHNTLCHRQADRQQYHANGRTYRVQQWDRLILTMRAPECLW